MKCIAIFFGVLAAAAGFAQEVTPQKAPVDRAVASPSTADCAADFSERGRAAQKPVDPEDVAGLRTALEHDLKDFQPDGLAGFSTFEPICFYSLPDGRVLMRDGRGFEFYFRKIPKWIPDRVDIDLSRLPQ